MNHVWKKQDVKTMEPRIQSPVSNREIKPLFQVAATVDSKNS